MFSLKRNINSEGCVFCVAHTHHTSPLSFILNILVRSVFWSIHNHNHSRNRSCRWEYLNISHQQFFVVFFYYYFRLLLRVVSVVVSNIEKPLEYFSNKQFHSESKIFAWIFLVVFFFDLFSFKFIPFSIQSGNQKFKWFGVKQKINNKIIWKRENFQSEREQSKREKEKKRKKK